ncbi:hypothetical protein BDR05DRAFT_989596 [Suillus weaverae]|nr:hypothetical protein BDR05DRAFT_989596 [Suillus weaverae]
MLSKLDNAPDTETRKLRQQYLRPSEVDRAIRKVIDVQLDNAPLRVLDTTTGLLCNREVQIRTFKMSIEYKELVSSTIMHQDIQMKRVEEAVKSYFQYVMLSHRWEGKEPLLQDIQGKELEYATGIDRRAVVAFRPGMRDAREKLQWASTRITTLQEDIAYSLSGVFGVRLRVDYGEKKQNALGRLLQEIIAQSGDITALDWVGESSEFNSCLPADIISYATPPYALPSLSEDEIQTGVSSLRKNPVAVDLASRLYDQLDHTCAARFAHHRLHLPCIVFPVTEARLRPNRDQDTYTYELKSDGLHDLRITTEDKFTPFSPARPPLAWQKILLVRPWCRDLLELHDLADDTHSVEHCQFICILTREHCG